MIDVNKLITDWLLDFSDCVRNLDYNKAKNMYSENSLYFGSYNHILNNLDELVEKQWKRIWPNITNFHFNFDQMVIEKCEHGEIVVVMIPWTSVGYDKSGTSFPRPGRLTLLLIWENRKNNFVAHHTHYSLYPGTPYETFAKQV